MTSVTEKIVVVSLMQSVPQTDTGGLVEKTKAIERTSFKELGKLAGRKFARCPAWSNPGYNKRVGGDCLTKTQVYANSKEYVYGLKPAQCWKVKCVGDHRKMLACK